jgi:hypothetical protein
MKHCGLTNQTPAPAYQSHHARAKRAIQSLYVSYVSLHGVLSLFQKRFYFLISATSYAADNTHYPFPGNLLDYLDNTYMLPASEVGTPTSACENRGTKHIPYSRYISRETIHAEQQGTIEGTIVYFLHQLDYQVHISALAYHTTQPKTSGYRKSHSHPDNAALKLYPYLICLNLSQVSGLLNQMLMNLLTVLSSTSLPGSHRAFVQIKSRHNSSYRTAISQKRYHLSYELHRISKTIEHCPFAFRKCFATDIAYIALFFEAVNAYVTMTHLSSCGTVWIVAEYLTGIHLLTPFVFFPLKRMSVDPLFCQLLSPRFNA